MKLISVAIPCYNSQGYMRKCIESILTGGEDVEIIVVNDGSTDDTLKIANEYAERYPTIVKVIDKENGGHGSGVNAGLAAATGLYYKVVDSDDWLDEASLRALIEKIKEHAAADILPDLYIANFIYDHAADHTQYVSGYAKKMPSDKIITWDKVKKFRFSHMLLMHALCFKREALLSSNTVLPEHTFYVDNFFAYNPLPYTKKICYLNLDLYHYYIGRADQSVTRANIVNRYEQQIRVMKCMFDAYRWDEIKRLPKGLRRYMLHCLNNVFTITCFFTGAKCSPERKAALKELWRYMKSTDKKLYRKLRYRSYASTALWLPWRIRGRMMSLGYNVLCRRVKLG